MGRGKVPASPLPQVDGVDAVRIRLPGEPDTRTFQWATIADYLVAHLPQPESDVRQAVRDGRFVHADGRPVTPSDPFHVGYVWTRRDLPTEPTHPEPLQILHRDENIVVFDKPHDMAPNPQGRHVRNTALARGRVVTGVPELSLAHRLDKGTAGVLLCTLNPAVRGTYQTLFAHGKTHKTYLAVVHAPHGTNHLPTERRSHIHFPRHHLQARELDDEQPNAHTLIHPLTHNPTTGLALLKLHPTTGRTHQLRIHLAALGVPIVNDVLYPEVTSEPDEPIRFDRPLQLLAHSLTFEDPLTGEQREFVTRRTLNLAAQASPH